MASLTTSLHTSTSTRLHFFIQPSHGFKLRRGPSVVIAQMAKPDSGVFSDGTLDGVQPKSKQSSQLNATAAKELTRVDTAPLDRLKRGFLKFKEQYMKQPGLVKELAAGQSPTYMIIACADSRVDPCTTLSLGLGEAFIIRNVANMVPSYTKPNSCYSTASAIEYAVLHLKVKHLLVIGHSRCGGIKALMGMEDDGSNKFSEFIEEWVVASKTVSNRVKRIFNNASFEEQCTSCEKEAVNHSLWNCLSYPFVKDAITEGKLSLHGGYYDFVNCSFERWTVDVNEISGLEKYQ